MKITDILMLLGGLALFLYGMQMMSNGLETAAGNKMKAVLESLTSNRFKGVLAGAVITAVIQSSSATTVMTVGFVNSGLMTLKQAVWVIMGANIGTTITGQLIALDMGAIAPLIAFAGVACIMFVKNEKIRHISEIFAGLGILFIGMGMMGDSMVPLRESEVFLGFMTNFKNPLIGILVGAAFTAVIQSSSASVGILQALAGTGMIPLSGAVYILFGQNIGTCITAVLASFGTKVNAKRTTIIHLMFNIIGTAVFTLICMATPFVSWMEMLAPGNPIAQIANTHTVFNIVTTLLLLPFGNLMAAIATKMLPGRREEESAVKRLEYIKPLDHVYPVGHSVLVLSQIEQEVTRMLSLTRENVKRSFEAVAERDVRILKEVEEQEEYIDYLNGEISRHIVKLMATEMKTEDSQNINGYYMIISNIERIGDHAMNIGEYAKDLDKWNTSFSEAALEEIKDMKKTCLKALDDIDFQDPSRSREILELSAKSEQRIDDMKEEYLKRQMKRMQKSTCEAQAGILYSELLTDFERIGDHVLNIAEVYQKMA
ncbi:Na/Pi cotransporter family protein [Murimonas intestini]|uniref:Phosphate:Na+ symporter n=1 Tax=Murimonas intestini TaxID=1337051 RepID=A0AB73T4P2_9FIRM|nr:Na/Pi cotransporter family protein [Murimonas intestini]MCR1840568.1 Na/Pi cotransporter family protein [Murimonas intestini]MCR1865378.1 Na/Pi cotransporter family protein [Murimonas intestini]MCR1882911.1 Na/Pi cotransporter family protein [Murimonas intestini]